MQLKKFAAILLVILVLPTTALAQTNQKQGILQTILSTLNFLEAQVTGMLSSASPLRMTAAAAVTGVPVLAATPALPMFMQVGSDPAWTTLPATYTMFYTGGYANNPIVTAMPQSIKQQYIAVGTVPKYNYPSYPVTAADLAATDENTFLHSTDPALLTLWKTAAGKALLTWQKDARPNVVTNYRVYKVSLPSTFVKPMLWSEWWNAQTFVKVADVATSSAATFSFEDTVSTTDISSGALVCYMVKEVLSTSVERTYSYPACNTYSALAAVPPVYVTGVKMTKLFENTDPLNALYANVGYFTDITLAGSEEKLNGYDAKMVVYNQDNGVGVMHTPNQQIGPLVEQSPRVQLFFKPGGGGVTLQGTLRRPYLTFISDVQKVTEDPVFRIAITRGGVTTMYPLDGGYYTLGVNNRVQDRLWYGNLVNPASTGWFNIMKKVLTGMKSRGFTGAFFDTWAPDFPEQFTNEAPSIELNPKGVMTNQYTQTLHTLGPKLKAAFPTMTFLANTIEQIGDTPKEVDSIKTIGGGMSESCIIMDGEMKTGASLLKQINGIEMILALDKIALCWPKFQQNRWGRTISISPFDPRSRIYALANALSITPGAGEKGRLFYGPEELYSLYTVTLGGTFGQSINYFPEYKIPIGAPAAHRVMLGTYQWQRQFEKGVVVVNADPVASLDYVVPFDGLYKVVITGEALQVDQLTKKVLQANPGTVTFDPVAKGAHIPVIASSSLILVSATSLPSIATTTPATTTAPFAIITPNGTAQTAGAVMKVTWSTGGVTDSQLTANLYRNGAYITTLGAYIPVSQGALDWTIPAGTPTGAGYAVALGTLGTQQRFVMSSNFSINAPVVSTTPSITITNPTAASTPVIGSTLTTTWTSANVTDSQLTINLYRNGAYVTTLGTGIAVSQGTQTWTIPATITAGSGYAVAIGTLGTQQLFAMTPTFSISAPAVVTTPSLSITNPTAASVPAIGGTLTTTWTSANVTDSQLTINLYRNNVYVTTLVSGITVPTGTFAWTVPSSITAGSGYAVAIGTLGTQQLFAMTPTFTIGAAAVVATTTPVAPVVNPTLTISSPTAATNSAVGTALPVSWVSTGPSTSKVTINLYRNGVYLTTLGTNIAVTQGTLNWTIPANIVPGSGYAVAIATLDALNLFAMTPTFSIQ